MSILLGRSRCNGVLLLARSVGDLVPEAARLGDGQAQESSRDQNLVMLGGWLHVGCLLHMASLVAAHIDIEVARLKSRSDSVRDRGRCCL